MGNEPAASQRDCVAMTLNRYFDLLYTCDVTQFDEVFGSHCSLQSADAHGTATVLPAAAYRDVLRKRTPPAASLAARDDRVLSIDVSEDRIATAKVRVRIHDKTYLDYLSLLRTSDGWRIVSKVFVQTA